MFVCISLILGVHLYMNFAYKSIVIPQDVIKYCVSGNHNLRFFNASKGCLDIKNKELWIA